MWHDYHRLVMQSEEDKHTKKSDCCLAAEHVGYVERDVNIQLTSSLSRLCPRLMTFSLATSSS